MPPIPGHWHSLLARHAKSIRAAAHKISKALEAQYVSKTQAQLETVLVRNSTKQPLHPVARIRQSQSRWFSTVRHVARSFNTGTGNASGGVNRSASPKSRIASCIQQSSGRAPFASSLRPNLTGGSLGRTAGGYTLGGGRLGGPRYFSHGPASQAQVVQNVSQAVRAFFTQGNKAQFDGISTSTGAPLYKTVTEKQYEAARKLQQIPKATPGSRIEFPINPTVTALTRLNAVAGYDQLSTQHPTHLNADGLLDALSADFSRALKDLAVVLNDLGRLAALGDLPITYEEAKLKVHFPGCDADTVCGICDELGIQRGTVVQDEAFDSFAGVEMALLFPFAPNQSLSESSCHSLYGLPPPYATNRDNHEPDPVLIDDLLTSDPSRFSTASTLSLDQMQVRSVSDPFFSGAESVGSSDSSEGDQDGPLEYQGFEGIYRFIEQCNSASRR
ncbi:hypothetical protein K431DRAFT_315660 [Polychaeton citri CBS 116435]|uniref:Casein kinase II beta 2 subunit n=1 Tax=Polychaeton citri CBS 116435 TaxID=1314669 RepID=A0A9P4Q1A2_9PEZI|nr:hypothetical protein K431DRAFT_315660 [Polychaeton citri CBS 116435]